MTRKTHPATGRPAVNQRNDHRWVRHHMGIWLHRGEATTVKPSAGMALFDRPEPSHDGTSVVARPGTRRTDQHRGGRSRHRAVRQRMHAITVRSGPERQPYRNPGMRSNLPGQMPRRDGQPPVIGAMITETDKMKRAGEIRNHQPRDNAHRQARPLPSKTPLRSPACRRWRRTIRHIARDGSGEPCSSRCALKAYLNPSRPRP